MTNNVFILGAGMTGLAAGLTSGFTIFEAEERSGGICSSYYIHPGENERLSERPAKEEAYRFELGGGHWIFSGDSAILQFIRHLTAIKSYSRRSSVYFRNRDLYVPYPLQYHLHYLGPELASKVLAEMVNSQGESATMKQWLERNFGSTLSRLFFFPFHHLYTAGLCDRIAPQDSYKSPVNLKLARKGASEALYSVGYNAKFVYPKEGLDALVKCLAESCDVRFGKKIVGIDVRRKEIYFDDGSDVGYERLISTLPLNKMTEMTGVCVEAEPDPYTSVLVLNIGAIRGKHCPDDHWLYNFDTRSGFHRVGFYSNVDRSFLPSSSRKSGNRVSIYVERAFAGGDKPLHAEILRYAEAVISELKEWGFVSDIEVLDSTWIDVGYTWTWSGSRWREIALKRLEENEIYQIGRYGRWIFQGIADSILDGLLAGSTVKCGEEWSNPDRYRKSLFALFSKNWRRSQVAQRFQQIHIMNVSNN